MPVQRADFAQPARPLSPNEAHPMERDDDSSDSTLANRRQFLLTAGSTVAAGVIAGCTRARVLAAALLLPVMSVPAVWAQAVQPPVSQIPGSVTAGAVTPDLRRLTLPHAVHMP